MVTASGGLEGLKLAKQVKPTVITLDVSLVVRACHSLGDSGRLAYSIIIELQTEWSYDRPHRSICRSLRYDCAKSGGLL